MNRRYRSLRRHAAPEFDSGAAVSLGRPDDLGTGPATMQRIRATLRKALNDAIRKSNNRLLDFNPAAHVELPSGTRPKARVWTDKAVQKWRETGERPSAVMVWTPQQAGEFLDYAEDHDIVLYPLFVLILHRGLRRGEAVGLPDSAVDLENALVTLSQQLATLGYTPMVKSVKTQSGNRVVSMDSFTLAALRTYHARRARWKLVSGSAWPDTGFFFVQPGGQAWHPETVTWRFERLVRDAGLPRFGCTTCGTAPRRSSRPPAPTSRTSRNCSATPRSPSPATRTPP
jgi:integrase